MGPHLQVFVRDRREMDIDEVEFSQVVDIRFSQSLVLFAVRVSQDSLGWDEATANSDCQAGLIGSIGLLDQLDDGARLENAPPVHGKGHGED